MLSDYLHTHRDKLPWLLLAFFLLLTAVPVILLVHHVRSYEAVIDRHLESRKWALPSTIYAEAPELYSGKPVTARWLVEYLQRLNYQETQSQQPGVAQYHVADNGVVFHGNPMFDLQKRPPVLVTFDKNGVKSLIDTENGQVLDNYEIDPLPITDLFGPQWENRQLIKLSQVPTYLPLAVIAIEDRRFYKHHGVDYYAIGRAIYTDLVRRKHIQGASTITQQLAKNFYLSPERSLKRKFSEALMAMILESRVSKEEILELYLNEVYLGQRGAMSINGVGAASQLYFHKQARNIDLPEAALLAGMIQAPNEYDPYNHPERAKQRRDTVLRVMRDQGLINEAQFARATATPIVVYSLDTRVSLAPYFGDLVKNQLLEKYPASRIYSENLRVFTTLDLQLQQMAEQSLIDGLDRIDRMRFRRTHKHVQGCLIAIEPSTGYIRAFVGGRSYSKSQFDRISQASRQPGSLFKPIVYAAAIESAFRPGSPTMTAATILQDEPTIFQYNTVTWEPKNYDGQYHGNVTARDALANSMNVATARLAQQVGLPLITDLAKAMGLPNVKPFPSLALGSFDASPWQIAQAYTVFANGGVRTELQAVKSVTDPSGKTLDRPQPHTQAILHPETAYILTNMMQTVLKSGTGAAAGRWGFHDPVAAGKTGTTNDYRDAWFIGYTPGLLCLVWTGYDDNSSLDMNGSEAALPIWAAFMKKAVAEYPQSDFVRPPGIVNEVIDPETGKLAGPYCITTRTEFFIEGTEPTEICTEYDHFALQPPDYYQPGTTQPYPGIPDPEQPGTDDDDGGG